MKVQGPSQGSNLVAVFSNTNKKVMSICVVAVLYHSCLRAVENM